MKSMKKYCALVMVLMSVFSYGCITDRHVKRNKDILLYTTATRPTVVEKQFVKIALLLDTSNSMDGLIDQAKAQLWDIVNEFTHARCGDSTSPELQIALYEYGNDNLAPREGYVRQVLNFSNDLDEISEKLFSLTTNGGEEFCGTVIDRSLKQLEWGKNPDDLKLIFIAGNEPFTQGKLDYRDAVGNAKEHDVVVNTIFCGDYHHGIDAKWKAGAELSGGDYMAIDHNREIVHIVTPYDDAMLRLNTKLNSTYISYGAMGNSKLAAQSAQDTKANEMAQSVSIARAVSKSSQFYKNATWDLVDAMEENATDFAIEKDALPEHLRTKSEAEIMAYVASKKAERQEIQKEIQALNLKREAFINQSNKSEKGELGNAMLMAIKKQAAKKNYSWE